MHAVEWDVTAIKGVYRRERQVAWKILVKQLGDSLRECEGYGTGGWFSG